MTLVTLLIALGLEYFLGNMDRYRPIDWFDNYCNWLESRLGRSGWWDGASGLLITLAGPVLLLIVLLNLFEYLNVLLTYVLTLLVLLYSLGPDLNALLNDYIDAVTDKDAPARQALEAEILADTEAETGQTEVVGALLVRAHERLFGVIFWFIVLDAVGALLFCLGIRLLQKYRDIHGGYANAARDLINILCWPSARLLALSFALGGSLVDALDGWRSVEGDSLAASDDVIKAAGLGALQYTPDHAPDDANDEYDPWLEWLLESQALLNRTLIVWLTILGVITIPGWLN